MTKKNPKKAKVGPQRVFLKASIIKRQSNKEFFDVIAKHLRFTDK